MAESEAHEAPLRRASYVDHDVVYASVGASAAPDLLRFPPAGTTPYAHELRIGSGAERFLMASSVLMTWGAQRAIGVEVTDVRQSDEDQYEGVVFDADGTPAAAPEAEVRYGPDGEPFLTAGTTAVLVWPAAAGAGARKVRVVYTVDEQRRVGFALGTADAEGAIGETVYAVEHRDDDTVWATARGFCSAPVNGVFGLKAKAAVKQEQQRVDRVLGALVPGVAQAAQTADAESDAPAAIEAETGEAPGGD